MPKARNKENKGLPARWRQIHGAYYYRVPDGLESAWDGKKQFRLGKTLPEAYKAWADRLATLDDAKTIGELLDRYALEVVPNKEITTQAHNAVAIKRLRAVLGAVPLTSIKPRHVYQYIDKRSAKTAAKREIEVLSHAYTKAVEWGYLDRHPFKREVRLEGQKPRTRYIEDWEIVECLSLEARRKSGSVLAIQAYIRIKLLTGLRRGDLLRLTMSDLKDDGIHVTPGKTENTTGKRLIYEWTDELRGAVAMAKSARPVTIAPWLFCNRRGECYFNEETGRAGGWDTMWRNFMERVLGETKVKEHFTEHDMRAKCASDAETLEHAQALLAHADGKVTERIYRRKPERVKPLR
ncbi:tyrosine-type recombinase/integrase [Paraburkholderia phymatum]|uniref:Integrase family protein n=1 Tax=Paraburkholderia phymatum (strain DSM 17167 / CIP 108236 / LMG 21445 / STM815) TaxID=391038 RepID=B2JD50_PARP8|nr:tyrosine-type recombinase/integrase [Paraburkholderia phymatum]ACC71106.1 integrase family protein [Paraburkholderia phymatum STM815]